MSDKKYPEPVVGALIFNKENKIFLMSSPKWQGKYIIPGGHIEIGETKDQALKREVKEETNLDIFDAEFLAIQECVSSDEFYDKNRHMIMIDHTCKTENDNVILNKEGSSYVWVTVEEALKMPLEKYTRVLIIQYKEKYNL